MKIIICVDERGGIAFNGRRQSRDRILIDDIRRTVGTGRLWVTPYSAKLFGEDCSMLEIHDTPTDKAKKDDYCFVELTGISECRDKIDELIIYNWNRHYPSDVVLDVSPSDIGLTLYTTAEFQGNSHEKITKEIYR